MGRIVVPEAEALLDQTIPVLDKGFVRLVDYMGGDARIVQAARVSYGAGTKSYREDRGLINYLLRNEHTSPFEQVVLTFHCRMPIFVARQWVRHRTARLNEISGRYSVMSEDCYVPSAEQLRKQSRNNKQGRAEEGLEPGVAEAMLAEIQADQQAMHAHYQGMIDKGLAREVARINLPLSLYTEWYWQMDLHNLFHFLRLRLHPHAQYEIRVYAEALARCARAVAPLAYEAFEQHLLESVRFGKDECAALRAMLSGGENPLQGRPRELFEEKLRALKEKAAASDSPDEPQLMD